MLSKELKKISRSIKESSMTSYKFKIFGDDYEFSGDFSEASSTILFDGEPTSYQVADFRHWPEEAAREYIRELIVASGDDPEDYEEDINEAIENMTEKKILTQDDPTEYTVSDGNATEKYDDWDDTVSAVESWYDYMDDDDHYKFEGGRPPFNPRRLEPGDVDSLNEAIREWENEIAESLDYESFHGHGNYSVSPASAMGLNLTVAVD
jgi:hypothetical protein